MSIFKESFPAHIKKQLLKRGEALVRRNLTDLVIHNGAKAWLRMSSSVDVKEDGGALAKNYILMGGALNNGKLKSGVGKGPENAYSLQTPSGKTHLYGIRPMPGITGVDIKSKGAYGSLREVTINFNCWDITQLEDLELLYMRPGYSVLLEWGWNPYVNNDGNLVSTFPSFDIFDSNLKGKDYQNVFKKLFEKEVEAQGNYGGFLGIIKNYKWSARPDGGYDCSTTLISIGEMIESLKINYTAANLSMTTLQTVGYLKMVDSYEEVDEDDLEKFYGRNFLSGLIYELWQSVDSSNSNAAYTKKDSFGVEYDMFAMDIEYHGDAAEEDEDFGDWNDQKWITLESLCRLINRHLTVGIVAEDGNKPIIGVSVSDRKYPSGGSIDILGATSPYLLGLCHPLQMSVNPSVCLIRNDIWGAFELPDDLVPSGSDATPPPNSGDPGPQVKNSDGTSKPITFGGVATPAETAAKSTLDLVIPQVKANDITDANETAAENALKTYFKACSDAGVSADDAANELQRQFEINAKVTPGTLYGSNVDTAGYSSETFHDFLDELLSESRIKGISSGLTNIKGKSLGIIQSKKNVIKAQKVAAEKAKEIKDAQEDAADDLSWMDGLKPFSVSDANGTADAACKAGLGQIGNIYLNLRYLLQACKDQGLESSDKTGKNTINLYDFLKKILTDVASSTGNVNNFDIHVDPIDSIARIIDINFVDTQSKADAYKNTFTFYSEDGTPTGKYNGLKSTVRNYSLESQIFSEQSSIVAIGAQTGGGELGLENDTMVGFNQGVKDRLKPKMSAMNTTSADNSSAIQLENLLTNLTPIYDFISDMGGWESDFKNEDAGKYEGALRDVIVIFRALSKNPIKFKAIIPTKLSLEIDGISNLIIGHMFNIHPDLLPKGYKTEGDTEAGRRLGYILTGIGHTINDSGWTTKLDGQTIILEDPDGKETDLFKITLSKSGKVEKATTKIGTDNKGNIVKTDVTLSPAQQQEVEQWVNFGGFKSFYKNGNFNPNTLLDAATAAKSCGFKITVTSGIRGGEGQGYHRTGWALDISGFNGLHSTASSNSQMEKNHAQYAANGDKMASALIKMGYKHLFTTGATGTSAETSQTKTFIWRSAGHFNHIHMSNSTEPAGWKNPNNVGKYSAQQKKYNPSKYK